MTDTDRDQVRAVDRAVTILQLIARDGEGRVSSLARALGVNRSTTFRILATLEQRGMVVQDGERGAYRLGRGVVELAAAATREGLPLTVVARPLCEALAAEIGETVNLAIFDGEAVISVDQVLGSATLTSVNWIGQRTPAHATSAGKVFLAFMSAEERARHLSGDLPAFTDQTITDPALLERELGVVRHRGYATTSEEHEVGLAAVAAPIFDSFGAVIAAVAVSGPAFRFRSDRLEQIATTVVEAAEALSARNGFVRLADPPTAGVERARTP
jgi:IclR family acetate operon transcriptional repressor